MRKITDRIMMSSNLMIPFMLYMLPFAAIGIMLIVDGCAGKGNPEVSERICNTPFEIQLADSCPLIVGESWKDMQICIHTARLAYEVKMIACIADGVLTEPGVE